ncbi:type II toxin-antitoxin system VapC family toxin [Vulcanisaeta sp. JCM 14467]
MTLIGKNIVIEPEEKYINEAFMIALGHKIPIYDALYIALATAKGLPLLTLDNKQGEVAKKMGVIVIAPP